MDLNNVTLGGRLTATPELRETKSGHSVCDVSIAINRMKEGEVDFIDVTLWGKTAEVASAHLIKGRFVNIQGRLKQDKWEDKEGKTRYGLSVTADNLYFGPKTNGSSGAETSDKSQSKSSKSKSEESEAVPF